MVSLKQVVKTCRDLQAIALPGSDEARWVAVVAALISTLPCGDVENAAKPLAMRVSATAETVAGGVEVPAEELMKVLDVADQVSAEAVVPFLSGHADTAGSWTAGAPYLYLPSCESTNLELKKTADTAPAGSLVVTDEQTGGRGRLGRSWWSGRGEDLTFSVLLRPSLAQEKVPLLSLAAALAAAEVLEVLPGLEDRVRVKWPNDVLVEGKKVCGILLEGAFADGLARWVVAGIGVNVNSRPDKVLAKMRSTGEDEGQGRPLPTSLRAELGTQVPRGLLLARLLIRLTKLWQGTADTGFLERLRARDALLGSHVEVYGGPPDGTLVVAGEAVGIGGQGELLVMSQTLGLVPVFAGEVTVRGVE